MSSSEVRAQPILDRAAVPPPTDAGRGLPGSWLSPEERIRFTRRSTATTLAVFAFDYGVIVALVAVALAPLPLAINLFAMLWAGFFIGALFTLGHDGCHQAFTPYRGLNRWLARLAYLPSAHNTSLWILGHNGIHHRFTNLKGVDYVWAPMSPAEYRAAPVWRRWLYRLYRSPVGALPYHLIEMWWKKMFLPISAEARVDLKSHLFDTAFVVAGQVALIAGTILLGHWLDPTRPLWEVVAIGWFGPFMVWNWIVGWVIYGHHTHPEVAWYDKPEEWTFYRGQIAGTVQARLPLVFDFFSNNIMEHTAHHALPTIPFYALEAAQEKIKRVFPEVRFVRFAQRYVALTRACKLFDFERRQWVDFKGRPTGPAIPLDPGAAVATAAA